MLRNKQILPSPLKYQSTIGIIAPSGRIANQGLFFEGVQILHEMGFRTKFPRDLWSGIDFFSASDLERSKEFNRIWNDVEVDAVMAARGGYGCIRMADGIDTEIIRQHPKIFLGFSDITVLHSHLSNSTGLITFHGPVVTSLSRLTKDSIRSLQAILTRKPVAWKEMGKVEILRGAETIRGVTTGGNLSTLVSALATRFDISWKDKIVFLEDTNEPLYKIDRMLTQLGLAGKFKEAAAVIIGDFAYGSNLDRNKAIQHHEVIWKRVLDLTESRTCVWGNFPIGHGLVNLTIPLGADIILNACSSEMQYN